LSPSPQRPAPSFLFTRRGGREALRGAAWRGFSSDDLISCDDIAGRDGGGGWGRVRVDEHLAECAVYDGGRGVRARPWLAAWGLVPAGVYHETTPLTHRIVTGSSWLAIASLALITTVVLGPLFPPPSDKRRAAGRQDVDDPRPRARHASSLTRAVAFALMRPVLASALPPASRPAEARHTLSSLLNGRRSKRGLETWRGSSHE
jgi:hypothetical protein